MRRLVEIAAADHLELVHGVGRLDSILIIEEILNAFRIGLALLPILDLSKISVDVNLRRERDRTFAPSHTLRDNLVLVHCVLRDLQSSLWSHLVADIAGAVRVVRLRAPPEATIRARVELGAVRVN